VSIRPLFSGSGSVSKFEGARNIVEQAIREKLDGSPLEDKDAGKNPAAVALGKLDGAKGGKARADKLTPAKRKAIAKKAADARWHK
jgi:hypothetical protein